MNETAPPILELERVAKRYRPDRPPALRVGRLALPRGSQTCVAGPSGCGKTTLLHLVSGILRPDEGRIVLDATDLGQLGGIALDRFRARKIGLVFQRFHLLPGFTARENVALALDFGGFGGDRAERVRTLLAELGVSELADRRPGEMSVGEQQRVALARALANEPPLILADEPTANLDPENTRAVLDLLLDLSRRHGATLLVVAHEPEVAERFERVLPLEELSW